MLLFLLAPVLGACDLVTGLDGGRVLGVLEWDRTAARRSETEAAFSRSVALASTTISAPDTVNAGVPFTAIIRTIGRNGCWESAGEDVTVGAHTAVVVPYDRDAMTRDVACQDFNIEIDHPVEIRFSQPGDALIRVRGRKVVGEDFRQAGERVEVEKRIVVR